MIVVSVGTNEARFDRLLEWISDLELEDDLVVQHGPSTVRPPGSRCVPYLPYEDLVELVRQSRAFVTHAGVGSIMMALFSGRRPVVVPRLKRFGEAVDDHQVSLARRLQGEGLVTQAKSVEALERALADGLHEVALTGGAAALQHDLHEYLAGLTRTLT